jgi:hypothetical protein
VFYLCRHCDRGQRYCSPRCREKSRRLQRREANRRYEQSLGPEGRLDHRQRQREYRQRLKARSDRIGASVTDQSSLRSSPCANLIAPRTSEPLRGEPVRGEFAEATQEPAWRPSPDTGLPVGWVVCQICGRQGRWVNPFLEVEHDFR